jgi:hypothetical protein
MGHSSEVSSNQPDPREVFDIDYDEDPNCVGYALYALGKLPEEWFVPPDSTGLRTLFEDEMSPVIDPTVAQLIVITKWLPLDGTKNKAWQVDHVAVIDSSDPRYATERPATGYPVGRVEVRECIDMAHKLSQLGVPYFCNLMRFNGQPESSSE